MFTLTHTLETSATVDQIWALVEDPLRWPSWHAGLVQVRLLAPPSRGAKGQLRFTPGGLRRFRLEQIRPLEAFQWVLLGFGREARFHLRLEASPLGTRVTQTVDVRGFGAWMDPWFRKRLLGQILPEATRALARLASAG